MCLYPTLIINKKYTVTKKNGGNVPPLPDGRVKYCPIGCQKCIECRSQKSREWMVRLSEEIRANKNGKFVTLTFSNESIAKINEEINTIEDNLEITRSDGYERDNKISTYAIRHFLENWRSKHKKSIRHWFITELGQNGTENIHIHGIIWSDHKWEEIKSKWIYGFADAGTYVNERTISYITKYITKMDFKHKNYLPKIMCSKGIGGNYIQRADAINNKYQEGKTREYYKSRSGHKISLPIYYRNKIYSEQEKEKLWIEKLDKNVRWVRGEKIDISKSEKEYYKILEWHQKINKQLGYGSPAVTWEQQQYERERRNMRRMERILMTNKKKAPSPVLAKVA